MAGLCLAVHDHLLAAVLLVVLLLEVVLLAGLLVAVVLLAVHLLVAVLVAVLLLAVVLLVAHPLVAVLFLVVLFRVVAVLALVVLYQGGHDLLVVLFHVVVVLYPFQAVDLAGVLLSAVGLGAVVLVQPFFSVLFKTTNPTRINASSSQAATYNPRNDDAYT